jgi:hypothetical protein
MEDVDEEVTAATTATTTSVVPRDVVQLWTEVENGLEKNQTGTLHD